MDAPPRKLLRLAALAAGLLLAPLVLLVGAVLLLVKPADLQPLLVEQVRERTGRELRLGAPLELDLWPCCALAVESAELGNPPGFPAEPFASVQAARLGLRLLPLLTRQEVVVGRVTLDGATLRLHVRADGTDNWTFGEAQEESPAAGPAGGDPGSFSVAGIQVRQAQLSWRDERDGSHYEVSELDLETGALGGAGPVPFSTAFRLRDVQEGLSLRLKLDAQASLDTVTATGTEARRATFRDLSGEFSADQAGEDPLAAAGRLRAPEVTVTLATDTTVAAPTLAVELGLTSAGFPEGQADFQGELREVRYDGDPAALHLGAFDGTLTTAGVAVGLTGSGRLGTGPADPDDFQGTLKLPALSPRELLAKLDGEVPQTADPRVLGALSGTARWFLRGDDAGLEDLQLRLDDTTITGRLETRLEGPSRNRFDLVLDTLDLDRYLAPEAEAPAGEAGAASEEVTELPLDTLRDLAGEGRLRIGRLRYAGLTLTDLGITGRAAGGTLGLDPVTATLYGGSYRGRITVDATRPAARLRLDQDIRNLGLGGFLTDFAELTTVDGRATGRVELTATGRTDAELMQGLGGNLDLQVAEGVYRGTDLWHEIRKARALLRREAPPPAPANPETRLEAMTLAGPIQDGTFRSREFLAQVPHLRLTGKLALDLPGEKIDGDLVALVFETPTFADGTSLPDLANVRIPLTVKGPLEDPKVRPDLQKMVREAGKEALRDAARDSAGKFLDRLQRRLGGGEAEAPAEPAAPPDGAAPAQPPPEEPKKKDPVKDALDRLFRGS